MKKILILVLVFGAIFTLSGCVSNSDITDVQDDLKKATDEVTSTASALATLKADLEKIESDLVSAYHATTVNTTLIATLEHQAIELKEKISLIENTLNSKVTVFSDGEYFPGTYNGSSFNSVVVDDESYDITFSSTVVVDRNGKVAGTHNDIVIPYSVNDKEDVHYILAGGNYKNPSFDVTGLRVNWNDIDNSSTLTAGDELTFIDGYMWSFFDKIRPDTTIVMATDTQAGNFMAPFNDLNLDTTPQYGQKYFTVSKTSYDQHVSIITNMQTLFENRKTELETADTGIIDLKIAKNNLYELENVTPLLTSIADIENSIDLAVSDLSTYNIEVIITDTEKSAHNYLYNIYTLTDSTQLDTAILNALSAIDSKQLDITNALEVYNSTYSTSYVADMNGHLDIAILEADKALLDTINDAIQIADINALIALDTDLTALDTEMLAYSDFNSLWSDLSSEENKLTKNYGPLYYINKYSTELIALEENLQFVTSQLEEISERLTSLDNIENILNSIDGTTQFELAKNNALVDEKLPFGLKIALDDSQGEYTPGTYITDLTREYKQTNQHDAYFIFKDENNSQTYVYYPTATALIGVAVDEYGNIASTFTNTLTLQTIELEEIALSTTSTSKLVAIDEYYYNATELVSEYDGIYDASLLDEDGNYTSIEYNLIYTRTTNSNYLGEVGNYLEYISIRGFIKVGDDYISKNAKFEKTDDGYRYLSWVDDGSGTKYWAPGNEYNLVVANECQSNDILYISNYVVNNMYNGFETFNYELLNGANFSENDTNSWSLYYHFILPMLTA